MKSHKEPILFLIFNRPDTTKRVFAEIKKYKPTKLFIAADGPRRNNSRDGWACLEARKITEHIDWPCVVKRLYRNNNLGCKKSVSAAIDWFFSKVDHGIIIEDDCLPNQSFFRFCEEMLLKYKNNNKVFHISGDNFQPRYRQSPNTSYFSIYTHIWGWATWKRAWKHYDVKMKSWPKVKKIGNLNKYWNTFWEKQFWTTVFDLVYAGKIDTWDYQWLYASWLENALSLNPGVNLVENIGMGNFGTHTNKTDSTHMIKSREMKFPIGTPQDVVCNTKFDEYSSINNFKHDPLTVLSLKFRYLREVLL